MAMEIRAGPEKFLREQRAFKGLYSNRLIIITEQGQLCPQTLVIEVGAWGRGT